jgi:DNA-binding Xre family transcriptional regulator
VENRITLRQFSQKIDSDPGNVSKLERSELDPPKRLSKIKSICIALERPDLEQLLVSLAFQHHLSKLMQEFEL